MSIEYQGKSIGRELVESVKEIYKDYQLVDVGKQHLASLKKERGIGCSC